MTQAQHSHGATSDMENRRDDFPGLKQDINGHPIVYLDSAASAQQPTAVMQAVAEYQQHNHANVHRGVHTLSHRATDAYEGSRDKIRGFINLSESEQQLVDTSVACVSKAVAALLEDGIERTMNRFN